MYCHILFFIFLCLKEILIFMSMYMPHNTVWPSHQHLIELRDIHIINTPHGLQVFFDVCNRGLQCAKIVAGTQFRVGFGQHVDFFTQDIHLTVGIRPLRHVHPLAHFYYVPQSVGLMPR